MTGVSAATPSGVPTRSPAGRSRSSRRTLAAAAMVAAGTSAAVTGTSRAAVVYTTRAAFNSAVRPGSYTESFDSLGDGDLGAPSKTFASGGFSFTASTGATVPTVNDLFGADGPTATDFELSTTTPSNLTFTFAGGNVTAVGGDFTLTDDSFDVVTTDTFQLALSDGTTVTRTGSATAPFVGFTSAVPITSLTFVIPADAAANDYFATVNNLTVGGTAAAAVPEPTSLAVAAVGCGAGLLGRRRRRAGTAN